MYEDVAREEAKRLSGRAGAISAFLEIGRTPGPESVDEYQQFGRDLAAFAEMIDDESLDRVCRCSRQLHADARDWLDVLGRHIEQGFEEADRQDLISALLIINWSWADISSYSPADHEVTEPPGALDVGVVDHEAGEESS